MPIAIFSKRLGGAFSGPDGGRPDWVDFFRLFRADLRSCARSRLTGSENARILEKGPWDARTLTPSRACPSPRDARARRIRGVRSARGGNMRAAVAPRAIPGTPRPPRASRGVGCYRFARPHRRRRRARRCVVSRGARVRVDVVAAWRARRTAPRVPRRSRVAESRRHARRATVVAAATRTRSGPRPDVWSEFRATHAGAWSPRVSVPTARPCIGSPARSRSAALETHARLVRVRRAREDPRR